MDPKRKKLYLMILVACVVLLVGVMVWSKSGVPEAAVLTGAPSATPNAPVSSRAPVANQEIKTDGIYPTPPVFPQARGFNSSALTDLKLMRGFQSLKLEDGELGRTNPLSTY